MPIIPENTPTGLSDAELLKIRTEVQADSARSVLDRARACLAEEWTHDDWPSRVGVLTWYTRSLAEELERVLERELEWARAAAEAQASGEDKPARPEWLYDTGCCDQWTPEHGCSDGRTGRAAMSLAARKLGEDGAR